MMCERAVLTETVAEHQRKDKYNVNSKVQIQTLEKERGNNRDIVFLYSSLVPVNIGENFISPKKNNYTQMFHNLLRRMYFVLYNPYYIQVHTTTTTNSLILQKKRLVLGCA